MRGYDKIGNEGLKTETRPQDLPASPESPEPLHILDFN